MSGGFIAGVEAPAVSYNMNTAVTSAGILLKKNTVSGEMELCGAGERADGYSVKSTENLAGTAVADVQCGALPIITGNVAELVLVPANIEVNIGDLIDTGADGKVDGEAAGTTHIGVALEHKAALDGAAAATKFIKVLLNQYTHF